MGLTRKELWNLRLRDARPYITECIGERPVYTASQLRTLLADLQSEWRFPKTLTLNYLIEYLENHLLLRRVTLTRVASTGNTTTHYPGELELYARPTATRFAIALGIRKGSFLSHLSAATIHGLTDLLPKTVYTNKEQAEKTSAWSPEDPPHLEQTAIDKAFSKPARRTGQAYNTEDDQGFVLLSGQHTGGLEIIEMTAPGGSYPVTSLERTLIDCTVRPAYAGGIHEVLTMYEAARESVSLRRLRVVLRQMRFIYPYHQAIGFLLERSGYPEERVRAFKNPMPKNDFYLDHNIPSLEYSSDWRIYHPSSI